MCAYNLIRWVENQGWGAIRSVWVVAGIEVDFGMKVERMGRALRLVEFSWSGIPSFRGDGGVPVFKELCNTLVGFLNCAKHFTTCLRRFFV